MRKLLLTAAVFLTAAFGIRAQPPSPQATPSAASRDADSRTVGPTSAAYVRPDAESRRKNYLNRIFGPYALARTVLGAGISTARNSPEEWGGQWEGFGRRVASGFGRNAIKQTTIYALDESFKLDSKFYRSQKRDFGSKVKNALISPVTARTSSGKKVFGFPRIAGTYTAAVVAAETWYPKRYDYKNGLRSGTISLGFNAAFNLFKEFTKK
jgi:hypothetical protein